MTAQGRCSLLPTNQKGALAVNTLLIPVDIFIQETLPDGKIVDRIAKPEALSSPDPASDKFAKSVITGKVTGDAVYEATLEQSHGAITIGGRVKDPGTLKNPLRFTVRAKFPNVYPKAQIETKKDGEKESKEERRAERKAKREADKKNTGKKPTAAEDTAKKIENDRIDLKWTDGTRKKQAIDTELDASSKDINGPGIAGIEADIAAYQGKKILIIATPESAISLSNDGPKALYQGFSVTWHPDPEKDKEGKARLTIDVK